MRNGPLFLITSILLSLATFPAVAFSQEWEGGCTFCHEDCPNPDKVRASSMDIGMIAIDHPPFACSESDGCDEEPPCNPTEEDAEDQASLLAMLEANDIQGISSFGQLLSENLEVIPERNLVLFSSGRCGNPVIGIFEATEEQLRALETPPDR